MPQEQPTDAHIDGAESTDHPLGRYDPLAEVDPRLAGIKHSGPWVAITLGVPIFAAGSGLACYYFLTMFSFTALIAAILGLAFALLVRVAARSILIEWLVARARAHAAAKPDQGAEAAGVDARGEDDAALPEELPEESPHARP